MILAEVGRCLVGSKPAARASLSSLPDTRTAPDPREARWRAIGRLLFALIAYPMMWSSPSRASLYAVKLAVMRALLYR